MKNLSTHLKKLGRKSKINQRNRRKEIIEKREDNNEIEKRKHGKKTQCITGCLFCKSN